MISPQVQESTEPSVSPPAEDIDHRRAVVQVARRYAFSAVLLSFGGNGVHLASKLDERARALATSTAGDVPTAAELVAEAAFGPVVVLISTHLLLHSVRRLTVETAALWLAALGGFVLSAVHLYGIGTAVGLGVAAILLPVATECAAVGSVLQYIRHRGELTEALATTERFHRLERDETARREQARRETAELARIEADRAAAELAAAERLESLARAERESKAAEALGNGAAAMASVRSGGRPKRGQSDAAIAAYLTEHPEATQTEIAKALGVNRKTVGRSSAWQLAIADRRSPADEPTPADTADASTEALAVVVETDPTPTSNMNGAV